MKPHHFVVRLVSLLSLLAFLALAGTAAAEDAAPVVVVATNKGEIVIELEPEKAPVTVENFLQYVDDGFYDGTIFHRVIPDFMVQGGGFTPEMQRKPTRDPIMIEADNGLANQRGTIAMARTGDPNSATAQFFINSKDNTFLNHQSKTPRGWGYTVFGRVVSGMETVDAISATPTTQVGPMSDVPGETILINSVRRKGTE